MLQNSTMNSASLYQNTRALERKIRTHPGNKFFPGSGLSLHSKWHGKLKMQGIIKGN